MKPTRTPQDLRKDCDAISSNCVSWEGPDITCLNLCAGDSITEFNYKLAELVCQLQEEINLTGIDLYCLDDSCTGCTLCNSEDKTLKNLLDCIIKKYCELETTISNIGTGGSPAECPEGLSVNVDCVETITGTTLPTNPTDDEIVQLIIDGVCKNDTIIESILTTITTIQNDCCNEGGDGGGVTDITYTNCDSILVTEPIGTIIQSLKTEQCDLRGDVGAEADVDTALSKQCDNTSLLDLLGLTFTQAQNLGQSEGHQWDILCALVDKVKEVETLQKECCQPDCSDIDMQVIGTIEDDGSGNKTFDFIFTFDGSTTVPFSGTDCGSVITLTDQGGNTQIINNVLLDDDTTWTGVPINPILDITGDITISVQTCLEFAEFNLKCVNCVKGVIPVASNCDYCTITIEGIDFDLNISYLNGGVLSTINVSGTGIKEIIIPGTAVIQAVVLNSGTISTITNDAECPGITITLDDVKELACYRVQIDEDFWDQEGGTVPRYMIKGIWNQGAVEVPISTVRADLGDSRAGDNGALPDGPIRLFPILRGRGYPGLISQGAVPSPASCEASLAYNDDTGGTDLDASWATIDSDISSSGSLVVTGLTELFINDDKSVGDTNDRYSGVVITAVAGLTNLYLELEMEPTNNPQNGPSPKVLLSFTEEADCDICT